MEKVLLLNSNFEYHATVTWKQAVKLMYRGCVEVVRYSEKEIQKGFLAPLVLRLLKAIRKFYGRAVQWSKANLYIRDDSTCQYCGIVLESRKLTVDHVIPQCRGGQTTWENTVACCSKCNNEKADAHGVKRWHLAKKPTQPTVMEFVRKKTRDLGIEQILIDMGVY